MDNDFRPPPRPEESSRETVDNSHQTPKNNQSNFKTPEQVAAEGFSSDDNQPDMHFNQTKHMAKRQSRKFMFSWPPTKKEWVGGTLIVLFGIVIVGFVLNHTGSKPIARAEPITKVAALKPKITTVASKLDGLQVSPSVNSQTVTGVMIENTPDARPQSGLSQAGVVFEAVAEGGITRFLALYQDQAPSNLGPVRSARPYYVQWDMGFDASYAHVGGSSDALGDIKAWGTHNLDYLNDPSAYHRITSRQAPHNVYTSIADLNQLEASKGYTSSTYSGFVRKSAAPIKTPTAATINMTLSSSTYNVEYNYDATTNSYNRSEGGAPQIDANTNTQLSPSVVIAMVVPETNGALDTTGAYYSDYAAIGSGQVYVFQDGTVTTGQWTKSSLASQIRFTDPNGQVIKLDPGQTWLTAITSPSKLTYAP